MTRTRQSDHLSDKLSTNLSTNFQAETNRNVEDEDFPQVRAGPIMRQTLPNQAFRPQEGQALLGPDRGALWENGVMGS
jgi:hypothetical protein